MDKRYGAFLLRWWRRDSGAQRIEIEHVQSDAKTVFASAPDAMAWVNALFDAEGQHSGRTMSGNGSFLVEGTTMSEQPQTLVQRFEQANDEAIRVVDSCPEEPWHTYHAAEKRPVNVLAHHIAVGHQIIAEWVQGIATRQPPPALTMDSFTEPNAEHARQYAKITKPEVIAELRLQAAAAASVVRGLSDEQLDHAGELLGRQMRARDVIEHILIGHVHNHLGSIREALVGANLDEVEAARVARLAP